MRRTSWPWLAAAVLAAAACFFLLSGRILPGASDRETGGQGFQLLGTAIQLIKHDYVDEPNPAKTMDGAFRGLVDSLDILSSYLVPADALKYKDSQKTVYQDSGVVLLKAFGGFPQVVGLVDNSPAAQSGLKPGDAISSINGRATYGLSLVETQLALKSRGNETAKIKVLRQARTMDLTLGRALPAGLPVSFIAAKGTAGILRLRMIAAPCTIEVRAMLNSRLRAGSGPLVLDLRNCSEGDPEEARQLLNLFLQADRIGSFLKRQGGSEILSCPQKPKWKSVPLAVWTNLGTQGMAELVAGVLQDFRRAKIIGLETPGLAAKTQLLSLPDGSALLLTTGVFALNSGKKIWGEGVKPDGEIDIRDDSPNSYLKKTVDLFSSR